METSTTRTQPRQKEKRLATGFVVMIVATLLLSVAGFAVGTSAVSAAETCHWSRPSYERSSGPWIHQRSSTVYSFTNNRGVYRGTKEIQQKSHQYLKKVKCTFSDGGYYFKKYRNNGWETRSRVCHFSFEPTRAHPQHRISCESWKYGGLIHWAGEVYIGKTGIYHGPN